MSHSESDTAFFAVADKFIALANELARTEGTATVGTALRYAAARYNAFEASLAAVDLAKEKQSTLDMLTADYGKMLLVNLDDHIARSTDTSS
jgi:hypothetical protein